MDDIADQIDQAADYIQENGWCQGKIQDDDGRVCLMGAFGSVGVSYDAEDAVRGQLRLEGRMSSRRRTGDLLWWNDHRCASKRSAVTLLRRTAKRLREEATND